MHISLALDSSGTPCVAYQDGSDGGKASVMRFAAAADLAPALTPVYKLLLSR